MPNGDFSNPFSVHNVIGPGHLPQAFLPDFTSPLPHKGLPTLFSPVYLHYPPKTLSLLSISYCTLLSPYVSSYSRHWQPAVPAALVAEYVYRSKSEFANFYCIRGTCTGESITVVTFQRCSFALGTLENVRMHLSDRAISRSCLAWV